MDEQAEAAIDSRLRRIFTNGVPAELVNAKGIQTRGTFLKNRPSSPLPSAVGVPKRERSGSHERDAAPGTENEKEEKEDVPEGEDESSTSSSDAGVQDEEIRKMFRQRVQDNLRYRRRMRERGERGADDERNL